MKARQFLFGARPPHAAAGDHNRALGRA